ncbi:MAG TPA: hypothetical protein DD706_01020 [Nitrospiraceae bacterium]|nr:hypothetical protein [Nitrospiraceae bacterium]
MDLQPAWSISTRQDFLAPLCGTLQDGVLGCLNAPDNVEGRGSFIASHRGHILKKKLNPHHTPEVEQLCIDFRWKDFFTGTEVLCPSFINNEVGEMYSRQPICGGSGWSLAIFRLAIDSQRMPCHNRKRLSDILVSQEEDGYSGTGTSIKKKRHHKASPPSYFSI